MINASQISGVSFERIIIIVTTNSSCVLFWTKIVPAWNSSFCIITRSKANLNRFHLIIWNAKAIWKIAQLFENLTDFFPYLCVKHSFPITCAKMSRFKIEAVFFLLAFKNTLWKLQLEIRQLEKLHLKNRQSMNFVPIKFVSEKLLPWKVQPVISSYSGFFPDQSSFWIVLFSSMLSIYIRLNHTR